MDKIIGADAVKLAGLQIDLLQKVRNGQRTFAHLEWFNRATKEDLDKFMSQGRVVDARFELINTFDLVVPKGYNHATRLATFAKMHKSEFICYNSDITDKNFGKAMTKLVSGLKFKVDIFQIKTRVGSEDCLAFLRSQKAVLTGAQGASLVYELAKNVLPANRWFASFDDKDALWKDSVGFHRVPYVYRVSDDGFEFRLGYFGAVWDGDVCLLCFRDC